jgi:hypothetical protein
LRCAGEQQIGKKKFEKNKEMTSRATFFLKEKKKGEWLL